VIEKAIKDHIGYSPPYSDGQHQGRALITSFFPRFEMDYGAFNAFLDVGLVRLLNDETVKGYGYYCRQIDFTRKDQFSRNYGDYFAGRYIRKYRTCRAGISVKKIWLT